MLLKTCNIVSSSESVQTQYDALFNRLEKIPKTEIATNVLKPSPGIAMNVLKT